LLSALGSAAIDTSTTIAADAGAAAEATDGDDKDADAAPTFDETLLPVELQLSPPMLPELPAAVPPSLPRASADAPAADDAAMPHGLAIGLEGAAAARGAAPLPATVAVPADVVALRSEAGAATGPALPTTPSGATDEIPASPIEAHVPALEAPQFAPLPLHAAAASSAVGQSVGAPALPIIAAPVASPDFAPALAAQVSVLARDGVQQAELRLNPAEMGPISVRIELDAGGTTASVHFAADVAATRSAIEAGLPELAGALREAGLTLVGGGVGEQAPRGRRDGGHDAAPGGHDDVTTDAATGDADAAPTAPRRARGVVDLVA
jgi:flagellar hook-length control protein FliK